MSIANLPYAAVAALSSFDGISLIDLQAEASFLTRRDRKYLVPVEAAASLFAGIEPGSRVLQIDGTREFSYTTRYFDDDHAAYFRTLRRRPNRFKVRTRLYNDTGICQLEVKVRDGRGMTVKERLNHDQSAFGALGIDDLAWLRAFPQIGEHADHLEPCLSTFYRRTTIVFPAGAGRMTIDRDLSFAGLDGHQLSLPGWLTIETKSAGAPLPMDRYLWAHGFRPVKASKFAFGVSLLHPELPANRWHRLLNQLEDQFVKVA
jgi:hypothetical protein